MVLWIEARLSDLERPQDRVGWCPCRAVPSPPTATSRQEGDVPAGQGGHTPLT
jgi:hypothetical protein